jgi:hypothetical protein
MSLLLLFFVVLGTINAHLSRHFEGTIAYLTTCFANSNDPTQAFKVSVFHRSTDADRWIPAARNNTVEAQWGFLLGCLELTLTLPAADRPLVLFFARKFSGFTVDVNECRVFSQIRLYFIVRDTWPDQLPGEFSDRPPHLPFVTYLLSDIVQIWRSAWAGLPFHHPQGASLLRLLAWLDEEMIARGLGQMNGADGFRAGEFGGASLVCTSRNKYGGSAPVLFALFYHGYFPPFIFY